MHFTKKNYYKHLKFMLSMHFTKIRHAKIQFSTVQFSNCLDYRESSSSVFETTSLEGTIRQTL